MLQSNSEYSYGSEFSRFAHLNRLSEVMSHCLP